MSAQELPPIPPNIASLTGPPLIGIMLNWGLYGALSVQVYIYSQYFHEDRKWMKWLVYGLYFLETAQTALATADAFHWFAIGYGNMISLSQPYASSVDAPIMDGIIAFIVQIFFCWRIWILSKRWALPTIIGACALTQMAGALAVGIRSIKINDVTKMRGSTAFAVIWYTGSALADTLIAIAMTYMLMRNKSTSLYSGDIIRRIVRLTIETNALTAIVAIIGFVTFFALPNASVFMVPSYALGKLYSNTLLVIFNNRLLLRQSNPQYSGETGIRPNGLPARPSQNINVSLAGDQGLPTNNSVTIETLKETKIDPETGFETYEPTKALEGSPFTTA